jgi:hypothetical protein
MAYGLGGRLGFMRNLQSLARKSAEGGKQNRTKRRVLSSSHGVMSSKNPLLAVSVVRTSDLIFS